MCVCLVLGLPTAQEVPEHPVLSGTGVEGPVHGEYHRADPNLLITSGKFSITGKQKFYKVRMLRNKSTVFPLIKAGSVSITLIQ